jgi:hypothetical protein
VFKPDGVFYVNVNSSDIIKHTTNFCKVLKIVVSNIRMDIHGYISLNKICNNDNTINLHKYLYLNIEHCKKNILFFVVN